MSIRNDAQAACSALVYSQYALCSYVTELNAAIRDLRRLSRAGLHPSAALDPVLARLGRVRADIRSEIEGISDLMGRPAELVGA